MKDKKSYNTMDLFAQFLISEDLFNQFEIAKQFTPQIPVGDVVSKYCSNLNIADVTLNSPGYIVSSLYFIFVLLREKLKSNCAIENLDKLGHNNIFFRRMRNAIAHGNINIDSEYNFEFYDQNMKNSQDKFEFKCSLNELIDIKRNLIKYYAFECVKNEGK